MSEEKNGYVKIDDRDMMEINAVADAWTRRVPMETVFEMAKRIHFHFTAHIFMTNKSEFETMKKVYQIEEVDINRTPQTINSLTESMLHRLDEIVGFEAISEEEMGEMEGDSPLPDAEFFKELGLN